MQSISPSIDQFAAKHRKRSTAIQGQSPLPQKFGENYMSICHTKSTADCLLRECGFVDSTRGVAGRSDITRWDLQRGPTRDEAGRTRALQWGLPRLKAE